MASLSISTSSTYKRYDGDIEKQWNESILKSELSKPREQLEIIQFEIESEKSSVCTPQEYDLREMLAKEFNLDEFTTIEKFIYIKSIDECQDKDVIAEAIVYHGDQEMLIV